jgi:hypothetical protein
MSSTKMKTLLATTAVLVMLTQAHAAELKSAGMFILKQSAIGCINSQDTLDPEKSRQFADERDEFFAHSPLDLEHLKQRVEKCAYFDPGKTFGAWGVIGQSPPQLPSDKVAICSLLSMYFVSGEGPTSCFWIVTDKTNVIWTEKR